MGCFAKNGLDLQLGCGGIIARSCVRRARRARVPACVRDVRDVRDA